VLTTERLVLHRLTAADAPFMLDLLNQPSFVDNIGDRGVRTIESARDYIERTIVASYDEHGYGLYKVERRTDGIPIGICGLVRRPFLDAADIGFAFLPAYESRGYAFESAQAVMRYAQGPLDLGRVLAIVSPKNTRSIRLLGKLGLEFERMIDLPTAGDPVAVYRTRQS